MPTPRQLFRLAGAVLAAALLLAACSSGGSSGEAGPDPEATTAGELDPGLVADLEETFARAVADTGTPGAAVLVRTPDGEWETAVGSADVEGDVALETGLRWPIRSITKSFTVTLLLQLADEGELSLDDTIDAYVDGVPNGDQVTLRQLADMTSGLGDYTSEAFIDDFIADPERWFTLDELIAYGLAEPARAEPGTDRFYTNLNTLLLGRVVEEVTGQPFAEVLDERILTPLGLDDTTYPTGPDDAVADAVGYAPDEAGDLTPEPVNFSVFGPAGAMISTTDDLATWGEALVAGGLVDEATQQARLEGGPLDAGPEYDTYAQGIGDLAGWWGHTGEGFGFTALVMQDVDNDSTVATVDNASGLERHGPTAIFAELAPLLAG